MGIGGGAQGHMNVLLKYLNSCHKGDKLNLFFFSEDGKNRKLWKYQNGEEHSFEIRH